MQRVLALVALPLMYVLGRLGSSHERNSRATSPFFPVNGLPPSTAPYLASQHSAFKDWRLEVDGLVEQPLSLSVEDLRAMDSVNQTTRHHCIQGWSAVGSWSGVPIAAIMELCRPLADARYVCFISSQCDDAGRPYHETLEIAQASQGKTIVALKMNGAPLTPAHGAPLRLRVETQLGFKMVKWLSQIEFLNDLSQADEAALGGTREDTMFYGRLAPI
jgi:DMSO/TMAO reductase YedYZ molybdopterin-dependent catalytic subunit